MKTARRYFAAILICGILAVALILAAKNGRGTMQTAPPEVTLKEAAPSTLKTHERGQQRETVQLIGTTIREATPELAREWARKLSRNDHEHAQRLFDLKHLKRGEVIKFTSIAENADKLSTDQLPLILSLPSFDGQTMQVQFDHLKIDGPEGGTMAGKVVGQPETHVVLGFHNGETSGVIEGPGKIIFLDAFDQEVAILRELDAAAHAKDFECDCMMHRAASEQRGE